MRKRREQLQVPDLGNGGKINTRITTLIIDQWISLRVHGEQDRAMATPVRSLSRTQVFLFAEMFTKIRRPIEC